MNTSKTFDFRFVGTNPKLLLELTNKSLQSLKSVEILTIFLKNDDSQGTGSRAHIRFDRIQSVQPNEKTVLSHRTWINGAPAQAEQDQLERLTLVPGEAKPYTLDISWEDPEGKTQFQSIPVGHAGKPTEGGG